MSRARSSVALKACALSALLFIVIGGARARDIIVTGSKPDKLFVIDATTRTVIAEHHIPRANGRVFTILVSPDGRTVYALVDKMDRVVGIDLASGREVFRAELSSADEQVKSFFALALTPDGKELVVYELPTKLLPAEYVVEQPRFAVFRTDAGLSAKPVRTFPAPRRVHLLFTRPNGTSFYAIGFDLYEYDLRTGKLLGTRGIQKWNVPDHGQPDVLAFWPVTEPSGVFTTPAYSDATQKGATVQMTSLMQLDMKSGELRYEDFEPTTALIFSTALSPDRTHAYGVYTTLASIDVGGHRLEKRVALDHTYYAVNVSSDGREVYLGGTTCDVGFYDAASLEKKAILKLPGCTDQSVSSLRVIQQK